MTAHDGRTVTYEHEPPGVLLPGQVSRTGNLERVSGLEGIVELYGYGDADPHNLTSAQYGQGMAAITLEYDQKDRVVRQLNGLSELRFDYSTPLRTDVTRTIRDDQGKLIGTSVKRYEYSVEGFLTKLVDSVGNVFVNVRDDDGRRLKFQVIPAGGDGTPSKETSFSYFPNGQLKDETTVLDDGETIVQSFEYDQGLTSAIQVVSSAAPDQIFRSEMVWEHDGNDLPTVPKAFRQRKSDGTFVETQVVANDLGQVVLVKPPRLPGKPAVQFRSTYFPLGGPSAGLLREQSHELHVRRARLPGLGDDSGRSRDRPGRDDAGRV